MGPNCNFSGCTYPIQVVSGGTLVVQQQAGITIITTAGGNTSLSDTQMFTNVIEATGTLTSNAAILIPQTTSTSIQGLTYAFYNNTSGAYSVTFAVEGGSGFEVAQHKRAMGYVDENGNLVRISPDT